jgi:hypothetical protein
MPLSVGSYVSLIDDKGGLRYGRIVDRDNPDPGWAVMEERGTGVRWAEPEDSPRWRVVTRQAVHAGAKLHPQPVAPVVTDEAVQAVAEDLMRRYELEYELPEKATWRDWADKARELLEIAAPHMRMPS